MMLGPMVRRRLFCLLTLGMAPLFPAVAQTLDTTEALKGSQGGEVTVTRTYGGTGLVSASLKWANCPGNEDFKDGRGRIVKFGSGALCHDGEVASWSGAGYAWFLGAEDSAPGAAVKTYPAKGKPDLTLSGDVVVVRNGQKLEAQARYKTMLGKMAGTPVDAVLERRSDTYYAVLDKDGKPLATVFTGHQGSRRVRYRLKGLIVGPGGTIDVDAEALLAPGESIQVNGPGK